MAISGSFARQNTIMYIIYFNVVSNMNITRQYLWLCINLVIGRNVTEVR